MKISPTRFQPCYQVVVVKPLAGSAWFNPNAVEAVPTFCSMADPAEVIEVVNVAIPTNSKTIYHYDAKDFAVVH